MNKNYLSIAEASRMLGISPSTLRRLEKSGRVEGYGLNVYYTPGGQRRYHYNELEHAYRQWGIFGEMGFGKKPCIIVRDLIRCFTDPASKAAYDQEYVVLHTKTLLDRALLYDIPVIFAITCYEHQHPVSTLWAQKIETNRMLVKGSVWTEIDPRLSGFPYFKILYSPYISPFFQSELADLLRDMGIDTTIVIGNSTSGCIRLTVIDALQHGFRTIVPKEAVGDRSEVVHQTALLEIEAKFADVVPMQKVINYLEKLKG